MLDTVYTAYREQRHVTLTGRFIDLCFLAMEGEAISRSHRLTSPQVLTRAGRPQANPGASIGAKNVLRPCSLLPASRGPSAWDSTDRNSWPLPTDRVLSMAKRQRDGDAASGHPNATWTTMDRAWLIYLPTASWARCHAACDWGIVPCIPDPLGIIATIIFI